MKSFQLKPFLLFLFVFITIFVISLYLSSPLMCEGTSLTDNLFFKVEETGKGVWKVFFKNVNVPYEVNHSERAGDTQNANFRFKELSSNVPDSERVDHTRVHNNVVDAAREHFNDIQRGNFHPNLPNVINPNAHGKGTTHNNGINSPLDQFTIRKFIQFTFNIVNNTKFTITNIGFYIVISAYLSSAWNIISSNLKKTVSNLWSSTQESIYATIHGIVLNQINAVKGQKFFPFIYVIFIFILVSNLIGMIPYNFSSTSHFILTFLISFTVVVGSTLLGLLTFRLVFFSVFVPSGCPVGLLPLLVLIELISYLARNISLGLRLAANVLSGHMLLNILSEFAYNIIGSGFKNVFLGSVPVSFIIAFSALEMAICFIQAQVFSVLSSSYIKDGIVSH